MTRVSRIVLVVASLGAIFGFVMGCGDEEPRGARTQPGGAGEQRPPSEGSGPAARSDGGDTTGRTPDGRVPVTGPDGSRTITAEDGTPEIILPPLPDRTAVEREEGCSGDGQSAPPPAPGLRASASDGVMTVDYSVAETSARCRPYQIRLTLYVSETGLSRTWNYPIRPSGRQDVEVPEYFEPDPDVVRASIITRDGRRSEVVSVLVR